MFSHAIVSSVCRYLVGTAIGLGLASGVTPAQAIPLSAGTTIAVSYDRPLCILPDLTATLDLTVESMTTNQIVLGIAVDNTTSPWFLTSRLTGLSWATNIVPSGASDTSLGYDAAITSTSIALDSNDGHGLRTSQSDLFALTLVGDFGNSTVDFSNFTAKFETIIGAFESTGTVTTAGSGSGGSLTGSPGNSVPEPSSLSIVGAALFAAFAYRVARAPAATAIRRRR